MAEKTNIGWTHHTFNLVWGCVKVSTGCLNCYADTLATRWGFDVWGKDKPRRTLGRKYWAEPHAWNAAAVAAGERRRVFCGSMCDWCEDHPTTRAQLPALFRLIDATAGLDWLLLTKRPERIGQSIPDHRPRPNVWLGTSIETMNQAWRADRLRACEAAVRFVSYEPALGPLDRMSLDGIDWVIYGGESGPGYRPHDLAWPRSMRDRCRAAGVAFFHKQSPAPTPEQGIELDGEIIREYPTPRAVA